MENLTIEPSVKTPKVDFQTATGILEVEVDLFLRIQQNFIDRYLIG